MKISYKILLGLVALSLFAVIAYAAPSWFAPNVCAGQWVNCGNAFVNDNNPSSKYTGYGSGSFELGYTTNAWDNYGIILPENAIIDGVLVRLKYKNSNTNGRSHLWVSNDNGPTLGPAHTIGGNTAWQSYTVDVTDDFVWTVADFNNQEFRTNLSCYKNNPLGSDSSCYLDIIEASVAFHLPP